MPYKIYQNVVVLLIKFDLQMLNGFQIKFTILTSERFLKKLLCKELLLFSVFKHDWNIEFDLWKKYKYNIQTKQ